MSNHTTKRSLAKFGQTRSIARICEISLIKSTNVQIMQDVLKYGKHLNIS